MSEKMRIHLSRARTLLENFQIFQVVTCLLLLTSDFYDSISPLFLYFCLLFALFLSIYPLLIFIDCSSLWILSSLFSSVIFSFFILFHHSVTPNLYFSFSSSSSFILYTLFSTVDLEAESMKYACQFFCAPLPFLHSSHPQWNPFLCTIHCFPWALIACFLY